jgi:hypothetical protein
LTDYALFMLLLIAPLPLALVLSPRAPMVRSGLVHRYVATLTWWCVIHISLALTLGFAGLFHARTVFTAEALIAIIGAAVLARSRHAVDWARPNKIVLALRDLSDREAFICVTVFFVFASLLVRVLTKVITDYDSLAYHLPTIARWYQVGRFDKLTDFPIISHYPYDWEALCAIFLFPFGDDFAVALPQLVGWTILAGVVYLLSRRAGAQRHLALVAACLATSLPTVLHQVHSLRVDLALAVAFLVGLYYGLGWAEHGDARDAAVALAALGMLCGIKTSGLVYYGPVLLVIVAAVAARERLVRRSFRLAPPSRVSEILAVSVGAVTLALEATPWYLRNFMEMGNPLGTVQVALGNWELFPGPYAAASVYQTTLAALFHFSDRQHLAILLYAVAGHLSLPFIVAGTFMLLGMLRRSGPFTPTVPGNVLALWAVLAVTAVLFWITPYSGDTGSHGWQITSWIGYQLRFAIPFAGVFVILGVTGLARFGWQADALAMMAPIAALTVLMLHTGTPVRSVTEFFGLWVGLVLAHMVVTEIVWTSARARVAIVIVLIATMGALVPAVNALRRRQAEDRRNAYRGVSTFIDAQVGRDEIIGYLFSRKSYLFYGEHLDRKVLYVHPRGADIDEWLARLRHARVAVVAVGPLPPEWTGDETPLRWLRDPNGPFRQVFGTDGRDAPLLYRLSADGGGTPPPAY